jgi:acetyl-CoA hydrolase
MRILDAEALDLAQFIRSGDSILWGQGAGEPVALTRALVAQRGRLGGVTAFLGIGASDTFSPEHADHIRFLSYCGTGPNRALAGAGCLDIVPCHYSQLPGLIRSGALKVDVALVQVPPADGSGRFSLGLSHDYLQSALQSARVVIAEINDCLPWTEGASWLYSADIDIAVRTSRPPLEADPRPAGAVEAAIAHHVAGLVEDGATLQLGIGTVPEAVLAALGAHRDLGIHSGVIGDGVADLMQRDVITNRRKSIDAGKTITGMALGSQRLYRFLDQNRDIGFRPADYTHDIDVLAQLERFVAINSALEVDLTGQMNAEVAGGVYVGAVGGAVDFLRGAARSRGGLPIVALSSRAGRCSRIVARLNGPVTAARSDGGLIVTEYGVADLRGASLETRVERMLAIAHPDQRAALEQDAETLGQSRTARVVPSQQ